MKYTLTLCLLLACSLAYGQPYYLNSFMAGDPGTESWSCLGPSTSEYGHPYSYSMNKGRINAIWVNPNYENVILAGADGGGLWKSVDTGQNWTCLTDQLASVSSNVYGMNGISWIAVDPLDSNTIYLALTNTSQYKKSSGYGLGLIYTTNGGSTWQQDEAFSSAVVGVGFTIWASPPAVTKVAYMPGTDQLFAITLYSNQVFMKGAATYGVWAGITPSPFVSPYITMGIDAAFCTDFDFTVQAPGSLVVTVNADGANTSQLWVCNVSSLTWTESDMTFPGFDQPYRNGPGLFSISSADTAYIQFYNPDSSMLLKTPLTSFTPTLLSPSMSGNNFPSSVSQFVVSPANDSVIYTANYSSGRCGNCDGIFSRSVIQGTDASFPWTELGAYSQHVDGRCLYIWKACHDPDSDIIFYGCDGGICRKTISETHTVSISGAGLVANEFYGMGSTEADGDIAVAGAQDNGNWSYSKNITGAVGEDLYFFC